MEPIHRKRPSPPKRWRRLSIILWDPRPVPRPRVDPELRYMPAIARASESIRYNLACLEHWVSPGGELREVCKISVGFALLFLVLSIPVAALATLLFQIELVAKSIFNILLYTVGIALIVIVGTNVLKRWSESRREDEDGDSDGFRRQ